ncbi:uncharacterized protein LTR77_001805 [Saxophila tyrrhenica]|uniref:NmrA-like domain-containing protein n=1 Tax=Saxophila tyrrhenica TaxID=1690608 RepID=A0AAV9PL46_9PEZI|nr:hypothetical protein LTR77_001805 [Saxophila tyrrhenica]
MRVSVFGASGVQGAAQVSALSLAGHHPVAVSRNPKPTSIDGKEIETCAADFTDTSGLKRAVKDAEAIFLNLPSTSFQPADTTIAAAKAVGEAAKGSEKKPLIVFNTSMPVPDESKGIEAQDHRREMRTLLREMGLPVISIQPVCFLDNLLEGWAWPPIRDEQKIVYCHKPTLDVSWIGLDDVAQLMIAAMTRPELAGRNFQVGGSEIVRLPGLAQRLGKAWGRELGVEFQTVEDFCEKIEAAMSSRSGIDGAVLSEQMFRAYRWYNDAPEEPFKIDMEPVLKELPAKLSTIEEWGRRHRPDVFNESITGLDSARACV